MRREEECLDGWRWLGASTGMVGVKAIGDRRREAVVAAKMGAVQTWALAAGGMVGGGIYVSLGTVIEASGQWAWAAFAVAGLAAVLTAWSYARLTTHFEASGGAFDFLEEIDRTSWAGSLSWLLVLGYVLTISVYSFAFGHYVAFAFGAGDLVTRGLSSAIMVAMIALNLAGVSKLTKVEVFIVCGNLLALLLLAGWGLAHWDVAALSEGIEQKSAASIFVGAAAIFMAYEGFQLLTYEYDEMDEPKRWFLPVLVSAAVVVVLIYVAVALGATMVDGAKVVVDHAAVALSVVAQRAVGTPGLIVMTVAAAFATSAAINSTLFSTAKLARRVADDGELPEWFAHQNGNDVPDRAIIAFGVVAGVLSLFGSLGSLVEAASLVFAATFTVVNAIAATHVEDHRILGALGGVASCAIGSVLTVRLWRTQPIPLAVLLGLTILILGVRLRRSD